MFIIEREDNEPMNLFFPLIYSVERNPIWVGNSQAELFPKMILFLLPFCYHNKPKQDEPRGKTFLVSPLIH